MGKEKVYASGLLPLSRTMQIFRHSRHCMCGEKEPDVQYRNMVQPRLALQLLSARLQVPLYNEKARQNAGSKTKHKLGAIPPQLVPSMASAFPRRLVDCSKCTAY